MSRTMPGPYLGDQQISVKWMSEIKYFGNDKAVQYTQSRYYHYPALTIEPWATCSEILGTSASHLFCDSLVSGILFLSLCQVEELIIPLPTLLLLVASMAWGKLSGGWGLVQIRGRGWFRDGWKVFWELETPANQISYWSFYVLDQSHI